MRRYFITFYTCSQSDNVSGYKIGWCTSICEDGSFVNRKSVENFVRSSKGNENVRDVIITNILELSESDFQDFIKEE
jgi:hypothetical protein